ncbi:1-phosphofructokinase [Pseudodesulfovibrio sediminis]|uniref:1-phosphofructokinase n=1 Tax=Pseudodesulfovibrio sediminis TaxID=2810563 RepID=A0ABM7P9X2_9BACT|nr:1-phosphofructokinase [Pseudodesulfovibrio sediminis]BCS89887.1 1-phosphofructokinase [Pseudodesulfovibrio sediminis]
MTEKTPIVTVTMNPAIDLTCSVPGFAAGTVNRVREHRMDPAGKGVNIAFLLRMFDLPVTVTGFLGTENSGIFERKFDALGITDRFIRVPGETRTGIKVLNADNGETTDINFPGLSPDAPHLEALFEEVRQLAVKDAIVVIGGSLPHGVSPEVVGRLIDIVRTQGARAVVDTSGPALKAAVESVPSLIKPNDDELADLVGRPMENLDDIVAEARRLHGEGIETVAVSLGARGALFLEGSDALMSSPPTIDPVSTVGAGDAMIGGLVAGMALGMPMEDRVRLATALSAATVAQSGPSLESLDMARALESQVVINTITL